MKANGRGWGSKASKLQRPSLFLPALDTLQQPDYADYSFDFEKPFDAAFAKPRQNSKNLGLH